LDLLLKSNDDSSLETSEDDECFELNEEFEVLEPMMPTLEQTILRLAQGIMDNENDDDMEIVALCNEMISSMDNKDELNTCVLPQMILEEHFTESEAFSFGIQPSGETSHLFRLNSFPPHFYSPLFNHYNIPMSRLKVLKCSICPPTRNTCSSCSL